MVPFYGQGMNAGMEDTRILFSTLDKHAKIHENDADRESPDPLSPMTPLQRSRALAEYSAVREPDAHAINDLALQNYVEMRSSVLSKRYRLRKFLEEFISVNFPSFGWHTKYARVSFSNEGYATIIRQSEHQGRVLMEGLLALLASPIFITAGIYLYRCRKSVLSTLFG